jgi:HEAT repeat protein
MTVRTPAYTAVFDQLAKEPDGTLKDTALQMKGIAVKSRHPAGDPSEKYNTEDLATIIELIRANPQDYTAVGALNRFGTNAAPALPALIELLENKKARYPGNIVGAISGLGPSASNAIPVLLTCLDEDDQGLVHNTLSALGRIGPAAIRAKPRLIEFLDDPVPILRWLAADSLRRVDPSALDHFLPVLLEPIKRDRYIDYFMDHQIRVLGELGDYAKPYLPKLRQMLEHGEQLRLVAAEVLQVLDPSARAEVVRAMIRTLDDETAMNPQLAAVILGKVGPYAKDALPSLRKLAAHESPWKAQSARDAISKIEPKSL